MNKKVAKTEWKSKVHKRNKQQTAGALEDIDGIVMVTVWACIISYLWCCIPLINPTLTSAVLCFVSTVK